MSENYPFIRGVTGSELPLNPNPYFSRTTLFNLRGATAKNYVMLGFKPGLPLQASELNEIQEIEAVNQTLTASMINSWPVYAPSHNETVVYGPGWDGATPVKPEGLVRYTNNLFTASPGWYLIRVASSGLKHWTYLNATFGVNLTVNNKVGFFVDYEVVKPVNDPSLYDNSSGTETITAGAPAGADRIHVKIYGLTANQGAINFSQIASINSDGAFYMNNVAVPTV